MSNPNAPKLTIQTDLFGGLYVQVGFNRVYVPPDLLPQFFTEVSFYAVTMLATEETSWAPVTDQAVTDGSSVTPTDPKAGG